LIYIEHPPFSLLSPLPCVEVVSQPTIVAFV
jgi:hypothetical protein